MLLIRHARTRVQPDTAPAHWPLESGTTVAINQLAAQLSAYPIAALVCSSEPKAIATGHALGAALALDVRSAAGLHEHERDASDFVADQAVFEARLRHFFAAPDERIWGRETAREAQARFAHAIEAVLRRHPQGDIAVVAHGTVITLFVALHNAVDPLAFWRALGMPACVVLGMPAFALMERIPV